MADKAKILKSFLNQTRKTTKSKSFKNSDYGKTNEYIDTGSYAINRIITGDIFKGIPTGKVTIFAGDTGSGKTYEAVVVIANALIKNDFDHIFYFDSEGGALEEMFEGMGCDTDKIEHVLLENVEDATIKILGTFSKIAAAKEECPELKFGVILDSLGGLVAKKLLTDAEKNKQAQDMGLRAKLCNSLMKGLTIPCLKYNIPFIVINHVYDDPASLFPSKIKSQSGGKGAQFMCRVGLQFAKSLKKPEDTDYEGFYGGSLIKVFTYKNSYAVPFHEAEMYLDFKRGPRKYDGLVDDAKRYGLVECPKQGWYKVKGNEKSVRLKELVSSDELWEPILKEFNKKSIEELSYNSKSNKIVDEIEQELNEKFDSEEEIVEITE